MERQLAIIPTNCSKQIWEFCLILFEASSLTSTSDYFMAGRTISKANPKLRCVACSQAVLDAYDKDPDQFILHTLNRPEFLQDVTGITADIAQMNS